MSDRIKKYIDEIFAKAESCPENDDMKQEILQNTLDKYNDLLAEGKTPEEAYTAAIASIGKLDGIIKKNTVTYTYTKEEVLRDRKKSAILLSVSVALYILSILPPILLDNTVFSETLAPALMFVIIAIATALIIYRAKTRLPKNARNTIVINGTAVPAPKMSTLEKVLITLGCVIGGLILCTVIAVSLFMTRVVNDGGNIAGFGIITDTYENANEYNVGDGEISEAISEIDIDWTDGEVNIVSYGGDTVSIQEGQVSDEDDMLRYRVANGKLSIKYRKSGTRFGLFSEPTNKTLFVKVPENIAKNLAKLSVETVSAQTNIAGIYCTNELSVETTSGKCILTDCSASDLDFDSVSGNLSFNGDVLSADVSTTSGDMVLDLTESIRELSSESVSGNLSLTIPQGRGFTVEFDTVSGDLDSTAAFVQKNKHRIYGDGTAKFDVESVSGDLNISLK